MLNGNSNYTFSAGCFFGLVYVVVIVTAYKNTNVHHVKFDITPPKVRSDWIQISNLLVRVLEEPSTQAKSSSRINNIPWILYQRYKTQQQIYQQLSRTAHAMQDMKYTILMAKKKREYGSGKVIGMIEFGVSMVQSTNSTVTPSIYKNITNFDPTPQRRLLMIGMIGIDRQYRKQGIASALVRRCETIALQQWKETEMHAHIEETNHMAIQCFSKLGFKSQINDTAPTRIDYISVRRRDKIEYVPHLLFTKKLLDKGKWRLHDREDVPAHQRRFDMNC